MSHIIDSLNAADKWAVLAAIVSLFTVMVAFLVAYKGRLEAERDQRELFHFTQEATKNLVTRLKLTISEGKANNRPPNETLAQLEGMLSLFVDRDETKDRMKN